MINQIFSGLIDVQQFLMKQIIENPVSWYAALLSTVLGIHTLSKEKLAVSVSYSANMHVAGQRNPEGGYISITVSNTGRRPVTIEKVGLKFFDKKQVGGENLIFRDSLTRGPKRLDEGDAGWTIIEPKNNLNLKNISYCWAIDGTGRIYKKKSSFLFVWTLKKFVVFLNDLPLIKYPIGFAYRFLIAT